MKRQLALLIVVVTTSTASAQSLPNTKPLDDKRDLAEVMVAGIDRFLDRQLDQAVKNRNKLWNLNFSSAAKYEASIQPNRERLAKILGVIDTRTPVELNKGPAIASSEAFDVYRVRWTVLPGIDGEGLWLEPRGPVTLAVVAIPDADQTPEDAVGLVDPNGPNQFARSLAESGCRVIVPALINRSDEFSGSERLKRFTNQTHREFIYRMSFEMGRHIIGYEIQRVLACVDYFAKDHLGPPIAVYGRGEGGMLAFYAGALDRRINATVVVGHFGPREKLHDEPIYRNVWNLLNEFGDGEVMQLIVPRAFIVQPEKVTIAPAPAVNGARRGAAPGKVAQFDFEATKAEMARITKSLGSNVGRDFIALCKDQAETFSWLHLKLRNLPPPAPLVKEDPTPRQKRLFDQLVTFTQNLQAEASRRRQETVWNRLDTKSVVQYDKSTAPLRDRFWNEIIGKLPEPTVPMNPRTRLAYETPKWKGYEVVLDVYDDVISYGVLLVPNDLKPGEKRPCVVCQHGLEGRPHDVVNPKERTKYYNSFGAELAERGYIVFAPQNPYIFQDRFRQLVRKANPLGLTLYSFIVRQHQVILDFLETLPYVDATKIAYYGLSYGGKVAMRIPALLMRYCLSICSGDFNEWIWKNVTLDWPGSYMFTGEYEMFEFDLGNTFNYSEMAALIAPRPFMVERGHNDGVGLDEYVAFEYAKVRRNYARLNLAARTDIEFFSGGHEIRLVGTLAFLKKHLGY